ncbi:hypothetical protein DFH09DRAFT_1098926 [Mycena vulgaris]|nr:hypothetical protein DFH09DRAFT_1098926 [Mycena vulgaris]
MKSRDESAVDGKSGSGGPGSEHESPSSFWRGVVANRQMRRTRRANLCRTASMEHLFAQNVWGYRRIDGLYDGPLVNDVDVERKRLMAHGPARVTHTRKYPETPNQTREGPAEDATARTHVIWPPAVTHPNPPMQVSVPRAEDDTSLYAVLVLSTPQRCPSLQPPKRNRGRATESQTLPTPSRVRTAVPTGPSCPLRPRKSRRRPPRHPLSDPAVRSYCQPWHIVYSPPMHAPYMPVVVVARSFSTLTWPCAPPYHPSRTVAVASRRILPATKPPRSVSDIDILCLLPDATADLTGVHGAGAEEDAAQISHPSPRMRYW